MNREATQPAIKIADLTKSFGDKTVLNGIDLEVAPGQILGYIGPNGAGKTTTVKILIGMLAVADFHLQLIAPCPAYEKTGRAGLVARPAPVFSIRLIGRSGGPTLPAQIV